MNQICLFTKQQCNDRKGSKAVRKDDVDRKIRGLTRQQAVQTQLLKASAILINENGHTIPFPCERFNIPLVLWITHVVFLVLPHHQLQTCLKRVAGGYMHVERAQLGAHCRNFEKEVGQQM
jgi:hypothetical protein